MVKLVVLYGPPADRDAFEWHYADTRTGLAAAVPGLRRFEAARGVWPAVTVAAAAVLWPVAHIGNIAELAVPINVALVLAFGGLAVARR